MKLRTYLRDRLPAALIAAGTWAMVLMILFAFRMPVHAAVIVSGLALAGRLCALCWDFLRKRAFYGNLTACAEQLDRKYLLSEMVTEPDFYEGRILCEVLKDSNKSMCEQIGAYRRETEAFREYIELWVHEVKLPVSGLELMCHNDGQTRYEEQIRRVDAEIENVLYYVRSGTAEKDYIIKTVSLKRVFSETALKHRAALQAKDISLRTEELGCEVLTDSKWLGFMLGQLMDNSMKYGATEISVSAEDCPDRTVLHFRDNGIGIPESDLPKVFEKSFTGQNGHARARSTGMGLYIVSQLCRKLGHGIRVQSEQGVYTEFCISFGKNDLHSVL
ncbi:MAG: sensor histidine kinase [Oscillospiraceae bacterium]|nr:sensor histidine kinase [Oscillospiraceae bacterium]